jgi:trk system potassium uptake protein TrkH
MNYKMMGKFIAQILIIEAIFMIPAMFISLGYGEYSAMWSFLVSLAACAVVSGVLFFSCKGAPSAFYAKEGLVCVGLSWIVLSLFGCLPFFLSREIPNYIDALFEIVSGFTTTGSSVVANVEGLSHGIIYWRSFSNWLGGMGVLVFLLAFTGAKGSGFTMHLLRAESPGPNVGKLVPKMRSTASILYVIYIVMTVINFLFLIFGKMPVFDALCSAMSTAGTGGFGIKNDSFASFSPYIQSVTTVFMILFAVNFSCYYLLLLGQFKSVFKDEELRVFIGIILGAVLLITLDIRSLYGSLEETVRHAFFQVGTMVSSTGFVSTDFDLWPSFSKAILICIMVVGACAGSTGGGLKVARLLLLLKGLRRNIRQTLNPQKVQVIRNNDAAVSEKVLDNTNAYLAAYGLILFISFVLVSIDGFSVETNFSAVVSCFNNMGPGFAAVGPTCNYSGYSAFS